MGIADTIVASSNVRGRVRPFRVIDKQPPGWQVTTKLPEHPQLVLPGRWHPTADYVHNDVLYSWGAAVARMLTIAGANYRISGMYMEYKNVASPGDVVTPPTITRANGRAYYNALSSSPNVDYLRVPLVASTLDNSNPTLFDDVNRMTFFAMSQGVTGINGKAFSSAANSKVYGGALVAIVDLADRTQDVIFSRFYFASNQQQVKLANSQIGQEWQIALV